MKKQMYLLLSFFVLAMFSCSVDDVNSNTESDVDTRKYPWSHVNPEGLEYIVYQGAAFCGDGFSNQIQIWAPSLADCQCLLNQFIAECDDQINYLTECHAVSSKYPPNDDDVCDG